MLKPIIRQIDAYRAADFDKTFVYLNPNRTPIDFTGCSGKMQIRISYNKSEILYEFSTDLGNMNLGSNGEVTLHASASETELWSFETAFYDLSITYPTGATDRFRQGKFLVSNRITQW